jgi:hypothetical protein
MAMNMESRLAMASEVAAPAAEQAAKAAANGAAQVRRAGEI